ncbi:hypothetical protein LCGC14_1839690 [marine sediment metagenome]|uniref:Uncharacterized protein n=1 Tax=marine sediment metagenome TaxID=412755 RepID=A0A0F9D9P9_9ZZZZ
MKEYVKSQTPIKKIIENYPILERFLLYKDSIIFSSVLINHYFGYKFMDYCTLITSKFLNNLLIELDKKENIYESYLH